MNEKPVIEMQTKAQLERQTLDFINQTDAA
jgi:hypothetical protein